MAKVHAVYDAIQAKYRFSIPSEYRTMEAAGWFDPHKETTYLWIPEMKWLRPQEILDFEPEEYSRPGFVPFAFDCRGDHWCWWPAQDPSAVVLCPHDDTGIFDAPSFAGSIYRRCLDYATGFERSEEATVRGYFDDWARRLSGYFPPRWIETLQLLGSADLIPVEFRKADGTLLSSGLAERMKRVEKLHSDKLKNLEKHFSFEEVTFLKAELQKYAMSLKNTLANTVQLLTDEQYAALVSRDLKFRRMDEEFNCMKD
jgi:hypothetical protein